MIVATATTITEDIGPLARIVAQYSDLIERNATAQGSTATDWDALREFVAVEDFKRVGAYQEVMNWNEYVGFMTEWAGTTRFESTVKRISEIGRVVFYEIEERHYKGDDFIRKNVIAVFAFDDSNKIRHLDIYEQAQDSGQWIIDAAHTATKPTAPS